MLTFLFSALATPICSAIVLVPAQSTSSREYAAKLLTDAEALSPTQFHLRHHPKSESRELVLTRLAEAQQSLLSGPAENAKGKFRAILELELADDWDAISREAFLFARLRLAQLDPERRNQWIEGALTLGSPPKENEAMIPPPVLEHWRAMATERRKVNLSASLGEWSAILINGRPCTAESCPPIPESFEPVRATFLSNRWIPQTYKIRLSEVSSLSPERIPWVKGACGQEQLHPLAAAMGAVSVFQSWNGECANEPLLDLRPLDRREVGLNIPSIPKESPARTDSRSLFQSKWFWLGAVVASATAVAVIRAQPRPAPAEVEERSPQTTTYGR